MSVELKKLFKKTFGIDSELISQAPGRLEILGNHTDYNEGFVLSAAVDSYTTIAFSKSAGKYCQVFSPQIDHNIRQIDLEKIEEPLTGKDWLNYIQGVIFELKKAGHSIQPFNALIQSSVPLSAGMSSSAALEMALVSGLCSLYKIDLSLEQKARIGQGCENHYIGANTGLMDQFTSLAGKKGHLVLSEYRKLSIKTVPFPEDLSILVFNSGVKHDLSNEYNERREQCEKAVEVLSKFYPNIKALRDVKMETLLKHQKDLPENTFKRALHVIGENERVHKALDLLKENDSASFGKLLFESHQSSIENFENSCDELDLLVGLAKESSLCLGTRLSGGGFGGISIHLIKNENLEEYQKYITSGFLEKYSKEPEYFLCNCADGASIL